MYQISLSPRTRSTPFTRRVTEAGVSAYTVYNHMLLPSVFHSLEEDYRHLKSAVQVWDVSCERQVELSGPDAARLAQMMTPRDLSNQKIGQCVYTPICDADGYVLNDPVTIKLADDRFWLSVADSDVILFAKGLAAGRDLNVRVFEPEVSPLAIQGPKADDLMAAMFGEDIRNTKFFGTQTHEFGGREHLIARSGYSVQGGFEIYVNGSDLGETIWDALMEAGRDLDVRAGCPNLIERIEGGLLSYGNDMTSEHTLQETGLARFCKNISPDCIAAKAIASAPPPSRQLRYFTFDGAPVSSITQPVALTLNGEKIGQISSATWSPDHQTNVAIGMIAGDHWSPGTTCDVDLLEPRQATVLPGPIATL